MIFGALPDSYAATPSSSYPDENLTLLSTDGTRIVNENGNVVILRGVNFYGYEYGYWDSHKESDYAKIASWGFNVVRLPITWNFIEPKPGWYNDTYLATTVDRDLAWAQKYLIYVIIDMHQIRWSSYFTFEGEDAAGEPNWAVGEYPNSASGQHQATSDFWNGKGPNGTLATPANPSMQERFVTMWQHVAARYGLSRVVAGYDILNEPAYPYLSGETDPSWYNFTTQTLPSFYAQVADGIRSVDPNHILFWEDPTAVPLNRPNTVYAPHYPGGGIWGYRGKNALIAAIEHLVLTSQTWNVPVFIGEWGVVASYASATLYIIDNLELYDKYNLGSAWWTFGRTTFEMVLLDGNGNPRTILINSLLRPFVRQSSPSTQVQTTFSQNNQSLDIQSSIASAQVWISVPEMYAIQTVRSLGDTIGSAVSLDGRTLLLSLSQALSNVLVQYSNAIVQLYNPGPQSECMTAYGNAQITTAQSKFGGSSLFLDGSTSPNSYVCSPFSSDWNFGTGDFTIDFWVRFNTLPTTNTQVTIVDAIDSGSVYWGLWLRNSAGTYQWNVQTDNINLFQTDDSISTGTWFHIAVVRSGSAFYVFRNGNLLGTDTNGNSFPTLRIAALQIGTDQPQSFGDPNLSGWLDDFRITKGLARWTSNFSPPAAPVTSDSSTVLLLHFEGANGSRTILDACLHPVRRT